MEKHLKLLNLNTSILVLFNSAHWFEDAGVRQASHLNDGPQSSRPQLARLCHPHGNYYLVTCLSAVVGGRRSLLYWESNKTPLSVTS